MIVNPTKEGWEVIYHRAHALLAAQIGGQWMSATRPERWVEILAAISGHDDLAKEWEGGQLNDAGAPMDFRHSTGDSLEPLYGLIESAVYRGRWVAMLTSMHVCFLNEPSRAQDAKIARFLDEQAEQQKAWRKALKVSKKDADAAYAFMQWCDRFSLILAMRQIPMRERAVEISTGPDGLRYDLHQHPDGTLTVTPWPFEDSAFAVRCEATYLTQLSFKNDAELVKALKGGEVRELTWHIGKGAQSGTVAITGEKYEPDKI